MFTLDLAHCVRMFTQAHEDSNLFRFNKFTIGVLGLQLHQCSETSVQHTVNSPILPIAEFPQNLENHSEYCRKRQEIDIFSRLVMYSTAQPTCSWLQKSFKVNFLCTGSFHFFVPGVRSSGVCVCVCMDVCVCVCQQPQSAQPSRAQKNKHQITYLAFQVLD